jgi:hypothetical protein
MTTQTDLASRARDFVEQQLWPLEHAILRREMTSQEEPFAPGPGVRLPASAQYHKGSLAPVPEALHRGLGRA